MFRSHSLFVNEKTHFSFDTISLKLKGTVEYSFFEAFFEEIAKGAYGDVVRAKALVQTEKGPFKFDLVYGKGQRAPFAHTIVDSRLVVIGDNLRKDALLSTACAKAG
jgi:G3E family GTPase